MNKATRPEDISSVTEAGWSVDQLADESGLSVRTIRYYQSKGLLAPPALQGRSAVYSRGHLDMLARIKDAKATRKLAGLYAESLAPTGRPAQVGHAQRGDRVEQVLRCVVGEGVEVLVSAERAGLSPTDVQTLLSEIAVVVQRRSQEGGTITPSLKPASPEGTMRLLEELVKSGLTDDQFRRLHPKAGETIRRHLAYVKGRDVFRAGSQNALVNHRLQLCLAFVRDRARRTSSATAQQLMDSCADDAARAIPIQ